MSTYGEFDDRFWDHEICSVCDMESDVRSEEELLIFLFYVLVGRAVYVMF